MTAEMEWGIADRARGEGFAPLDGLNGWWQDFQPCLPYGATTREEWTAWRRQLRTAVQAHLGTLPPPLALAPRLSAQGRFAGDIAYRYGEVETAEGFIVPFLVLVPPGVTAATPGVLCLHGHGDGMNPLVGLDAAGQPLDGEYEHTFALEACRRGFVVLTFDLLGFGRRRDFAYNAQFAENSCNSPSKIALHLGATMLGLRVSDARRMLALLGMQPEVDAERLGVVGISGGGAVAFFTTLLDDRVRAATISGYFNRFSAFMQVPHCVDNFVPGLATVAEMPDMACAIAPRPLLISQGTRDPIFPIAATRDGVARLRDAYRLWAADACLEEEYFDDEHTFSNARVWDFLTQWL